MDKKTLGIILVVLIVAVAGVVYFGWQKDLFYSGGKTIEIGGKKVSEKEFLKDCLKVAGSQEEKEGCYMTTAIYFKDVSLCDKISNSEGKRACKELVETSPGFQPVMPDGAMPGTPQGEGQEEGQKDPYGSAQEIKVPTGSAVGLASELKAIFSEVCGGAKLTTLNYNFPAQGADMLIYVWKNKPTEEKLRSALVKNGYEIEEGGFSDILFAKKGNLFLTIDWASLDREEGQESVVLAGKEE
ncbi:MAG: hypothetical protein Q8L57_00670 [bacterium]|nr:hypothetical protein [bacterium]